MDVKHESSNVFNSTESISLELDLNLKRKRTATVEHPAENHGTVSQLCKFPKAEAAKPKYEGSVVYQSLSPEVYGWPSKVCVQDACNFLRSGSPSRFMFYDEGEWKDYSKDVVIELCVSFRARKSSVELSVDGRRYLVNFLQMLQLNLLTGFARSVAWIDEHDKCFFPSKLVEGHGARLFSQLQDASGYQFPLTLPDFNSEACARGFDSFHDGFIGICSDLPKPPEATSSLEATSEVTSDRRVGEEALEHAETPLPRVSHDFVLLGDKVQKLNEGDQEFAVVQNRFLAGLGMLATYTTITGIYKDSHRSTSGQARLQAFKKQVELTKNARGNANVRYAWHGTSKQGVSGIVLHGFGQPRMPKNGAMYGVGVYLAPEEYSHVSAVYSDVDENGEQHMVLCQAVMGSMEQVHPGSEQFHPSSEDYDTGVDDLCTPKRYIIWSTHMNTHILPQYIVSFKLSPQWREVIAALRGKQTSGKVLPIPRGPQSEGQGRTEPSTVKVGEVTSALSCKTELEVSSGVEFSQGCPRKLPRSPWMSFPMLFLVMKSKLPPANMAALQQHYLEFKAGRMSRDMLIRNVRSVAGDRILADSIKSMQAQEKASPSLMRMDSCSTAGVLGMKEDNTTPVTSDTNSSNEAL